MVIATRKEDGDKRHRGRRRRAHARCLNDLDIQTYSTGQVDKKDGRNRVPSRWGRGKRRKERSLVNKIEKQVEDKRPAEDEGGQACNPCSLELDGWFQKKRRRTCGKKYEKSRMPTEVVAVVVVVCKDTKLRSHRNDEEKLKFGNSMNLVTRFFSLKIQKQKDAVRNGKKQKFRFFSKKRATSESHVKWKINEIKEMKKTI